MARSLVIVESPAKAKTINKYLGRNYSVKASYGHVMDLPKKTIGILLPADADGNGKHKTKRKTKKKTAAGDKATEKKPVKTTAATPEEEFEPTYEVIPSKFKVVSELRKAAESAENVYLATDPDREGEAISAHLLEALSRKKSDRGKFYRVMFHEITQKAIRAAFEKPGVIDEHLVDAQQARRVLDRLVGYKVSPLLWDKVRRGLSAGRVQTVALRLIVEREREIRAFVPQEYWSIHALLEASEAPSFEAKLTKYKGKEIEIPNEAESQRILADLDRAGWQVASVVQKEKRRFAPPPFTTSKLQQAGYNRLRYTAKRTMMLAQRLYEGVELGAEGSVALITYMRTDSVHVSSDALAQVREHIGSSYGEKYLPNKPNFFKSKKDAQEAHEAVRPTDVARTPESVKAYLPDDMFRLYQMIWQRFVASQMVPAVFDQTTVDISANDYIFRASGSVIKFDGYLAAYQAVKEEEEKEDEGDADARTLPRVSEGEQLRLEAIRPEQHFTEPPPRYTEATLVKDLEEKGIGRPSTYATIISTIVEREYVNKNQGRFTTTLLGEKVSDLLVKSFGDVFDVGFTARLEDELDEIEEGKLPWKKSVKEFWGRFEDDLGKAASKMESYKIGIPTGEKCEKCGQGELLERISRHGFFLGCSRYPECDFIRDLSDTGSEEVEGVETVQYCDNCGKEMIMKRGRFGAFLACSGYPDCKTTRRLVSGTKKAKAPDVPIGEKCSTCGGELLRRAGRFGDFIGCQNYPKCKYTRPITLGIKCPKCGEGEFVRRGSAKGRGRARIFYGCSRYPDCDFTTPHEPLPEPCPKCSAPFVVEKHTKQGNFRACLRESCDWEEAAPESVSAHEAVASVAEPQPVGASKS
ncbi:MAG TPA: type I DNA topoisomerase [Candidatus Acidoferrales bacterium]|nr:type I DNA topoisomerase [Candidatus Acidoferrales bacterium]